MCPWRLTPQTPALPLEMRVSLPGIDCHLAVIRTFPVAGFRTLWVFHVLKYNYNGYFRYIRLYLSTNTLIVPPSKRACVTIDYTSSGYYFSGFPAKASGFLSLFYLFKLYLSILKTINTNLLPRIFPFCLQNIKAAQNGIDIWRSVHRMSRVSCDLLMAIFLRPILLPRNGVHANGTIPASISIYVQIGAMWHNEKSLLKTVLGSTIEY